MERIVKVSKIENGTMTLSGFKESSCGDCGGKSSCSTLGSWKKRVFEIKIPDEGKYLLGETLKLEIEDKIFMRIAFFLYGLPVIIFSVSGYTLEQLFKNNLYLDIISFFVSMGIVGLYYLIVPGKMKNPDIKIVSLNKGLTNLLLEHNK